MHATGPTGFLRRKTICIFLAVACTTLGVMKVYDFLAVTEPTSEGVLVVEAWIPAATLAEAVHRFDRGNYDCLIVVGGPMPQDARNPKHLRSYSDFALDQIVSLGFDPNKIIKIDVVKSGSRTLNMAKAVDTWMSQSGRVGKSLDVFTVGVHARKSWITYSSVAGGRYRVGIIAGAESSYNPSNWLLSRRGLWIVSRNLAGYLYTKLVLT